MPKEIVGIGAANVDIMGESAARLVMEDSNPGTLSVSVGGVTRNVCENTARLGLPTRLITTVGGHVRRKDPLLVPGMRHRHR